MEVISFKEALENECIWIFDDECAEILKKGEKGELSDFQVQEYAGPVISEYLVNLLVHDKNGENLKVFKTLLKQINESYTQSKKNAEAELKRLNLRVIK